MSGRGFGSELPVTWNHDHDQGEGEKEAGNGVTCDVGPVTISYSTM